MPTVAIDARDAHEPVLRGWGRYTRDLIAALRRNPAGLDIEALHQGGAGPELLFEQVRLPRALRRLGAGVVHAPNAFLPLRRPCPGVVTIHDLAFEEFPEDFSRRTGWKYRSFAPRAARSAERVILPSHATRDDVCERYRVDPDRTRVIPQAPSLPRGHEQPPAGPYLLAVGDLRRKKNLTRLVRAFRALRADGLPHRLVLAGLDAGAGERLREEAAGAPVELEGYVSDARLDALMRGADVLVYPSLHEGFGLAVVEAMARGCPVAASDATSLPEAGGDAAVYFDPRDVDAIATAVRSVTGDPALRARMVERGLARAAELSWERTARETVAVYRELL